MKVRTSIFSALAIVTLATAPASAWNPFSGEAINWNDAASVQAAFPEIKDATEADKSVFAGTLMLIAAERSEVAKAKGLKGEDAVPPFIFSGEGKNMMQLLQGVTKAEVMARFEEQKKKAAAKGATNKPSTLVPKVEPSPAEVNATDAIARQKKCIADKVKISNVKQGEGEFIDDYTYFDITNNTSLPFAWLSIQVDVKDARYGNVLDRNRSGLTLDKTIGPGETGNAGIYTGLLPVEGNKVEITALNIRDLEGKRLVDDNINYIGGNVDYPKEISSVACE